MLYLDNNATTIIALEVREAMAPFLSERYGNPSSPYPFGGAVRRSLEEARLLVAELLGRKHAREIVFTSGATESNNAAIRSAFKTFPSRRTLVTSQVEHSSIRTLCKVLEEEGHRVVSIGVSRTGALDWDALDRALTGDVAIVSMMWANNETGVLFPIHEVAQLVKAKGILLHVDAAQAVGKVPIDLGGVPIDFLSASAHKFHGPKGIGLLFIREDTPFHPLIVGGRQELDRRAGTEYVAGIVGLSRALELASASLDQDGERIASLRNRLEEGLLSQIPESFVNGASEQRLPNTANMTIPGIEAETFLIRLGELGVCVSSGSACLTGALEPSHVLQAMGLSRDLALSSVRLSLSRYTRSEEVDQVLRVIPRLVSELRERKEVQSESTV